MLKLLSRTALLLLLSCATGGSLLADQEPIRIGVIFAKSGVAGVANQQAFQTVRYTAEQVNQAGGVLGRPIKLYEFDNLSTALGSRSAAQQAVAAKVSAVVGASWSSHSLAMAKVLQPAGIPMVAPTSSNPAVTQVGDYIFRTCFTDDQQGKILARFAYNDLQARRGAVIVNTGSSYSIGLADAFSQEFTAIGGSLTPRLEYLKDVTPPNELLATLVGSDADIIFFPSHEEVAGVIISAARKLGIGTPFLGGDGWSPRMYELAGNVIDGSYYSNYWNMNDDSPEMQRLQAGMRERIGVITRGLVPFTHDATLLLVDAIERAGSDESAKIRDALAATRDFHATGRTISMGPGGDPLDTPAYIMKFDQGSPRFIKQAK